MKDVFLKPGDCFVGHRGQRVHTLLGSCVAITLWHPPTGAGGMCHFLLAGRPPGASEDTRYGDVALGAMVRGLARLGVRARDCEAKLFGGGAMFGRHGPYHIGRRNGEGARALLAQHAIVVCAHSLFGRGHRKVVFDLKTGDVWVQHAPGAVGPRGGEGAA